MNSILNCQKNRPLTAEADRDLVHQTRYLFLVLPSRADYAIYFFLILLILLGFSFTLILAGRPAITPSGRLVHSISNPLVHQQYAGGVRVASCNDGPCVPAGPIPICTPPAPGTPGGCGYSISNDADGSWRGHPVPDPSCTGPYGCGYTVEGTSNA